MGSLPRGGGSKSREGRRDPARWQPAGGGGGERRRLTGEQHGGEEEQEAGRHGRHQCLSGLVRLQPDGYGMMRMGVRMGCCGSVAAWRAEGRRCWLAEPSCGGPEHCRLIEVSFRSIKLRKGARSGGLCRSAPPTSGAAGGGLAWLDQSLHSSLMSDKTLAGPNLTASGRAAGYVHAALARACRVAGRALQVTYQSSCATEHSWLTPPAPRSAPQAPCSRPAAAAAAAAACWPSRPAQS